MSVGEWITVVVFFAGVLGSLVFVIGRLRTRFWQYAEGMALLLQHLMWVGLGVNTLIYMVWGDHWWRLPVGIALLLFFGGSVWWLTYLQERARRSAVPAAQTVQPSLQESHPLTEDHQLG